MPWKITSSRFHVSIEDRIATVTLDRQDRHHALGSQDTLATSVSLCCPVTEK
jgi:hypothetical protein